MEPDGMNWILQIANAFALLVSVAVNIWLYFKARADKRFSAIDKRFTAMDKTLTKERTTWQSRQAQHGERISMLENNAPSHKDLTELRAAVGETNARVAAVSERSEITQEMVRSIHEHLLEKGR